MELEAIFTLVVIGLTVFALAKELASPDLILFGAMAFLMLGGVLTPAEAFAGFSNPGVLVIGLLFIVSAAIQNTGALNYLTSNVFTATGGGGLGSRLFRMIVPVSFLSAFFSNTAIVIIFVPIIKKWAEKISIPSSKLFIPLSYAAILGGMCTLIGTSTNLVVHGLMLENNFEGLSLFELTKIGVPCVVAGTLYLTCVGKNLLPDHKDMTAMVSENMKEYVVEMKVKRGCELIGKTVQEAGLRNLRGLFLIDVEREGRSVGPISSQERIDAEDRLMFVGLTSAVVELQGIPGLVAAAHEMFEKDFASMRTHLLEAVVSARSPILGNTVKECNFRAKYGAGVVAVHRNGERIVSKIGSIQLKAGDTLLLLAPPRFVDTWKDSQDFYVISNIKTIAPEAGNKAYLALGISLLMILGTALAPRFLTIGGQPVSVVHCVFAAVILMVLTRSILPLEAKQSIRWDILITIACGFSLSRALQSSGAADFIASILTQASGFIGPVGVLMLLYLTTVFFTEAVTNAAAVALTFPIAMSAATQLGVDPRPFFIAITIAASSSFATPIGYQTNLIVKAAGGYRFRDYFKVGIPLSIICFLVAAVLIPVFWRF
ncbi:MAG: SLC13 family permease [Candidatus Omnitrophota bacterium]|nr:SLC13 family permease [Candidatus Omnitrophota bacterium]